MTTPPPEAGALLYSIEEAARSTSLSPRFLRTLISNGAIPVVKIGRLVRIRPTDLSTYIDAHTVVTPR